MKSCPTCGRQWPDEQRFCPNDGSALKTSGGSDLVGSVIAGNYHIEKKLGEGGMGAVYLGKHVKMGRKSAIKVMTQAMANDPDAIARFNREATNAARINHPNVCAIYDFGETPDGLIYLAMEFIEGQSLSDLLDQEGALSPQRAAAIFQQCGDALQAAHDLGIVHRDIKPDNIMISRGKGGVDVVKVVDFGIAKAASGEEGQKVTKTGLVVGTPEYMSPEQLAGDKLDGRSDNYSIALVLYRMLTGTLPFQADNAQEIMIKRLTDEPLPLSAARPDIAFPEQLQAVMAKALQRMPGNRYVGAAELARDVTQAVRGMADVGARMDADGATQLISAQPGASLAATRVGGGRAASPALGQTTRVPTPDTPTVAQQPPVRPKRKPVMAIAAAAVVVLGGGTAALVMAKGGTQNAPSVTHDTAQKAPPGTLSSQRPVGNTATRDPRTQAAPNQPRDSSRTPVEPPPERGIPVSIQDASDRLFGVMDHFSTGGATPGPVASAARDTAIAYYNAAGMSPKDRALAAYVVSQAEGALENKPEALRWAQIAVGLDPSNKSFQANLTSLSRPPE